MISLLKMFSKGSNTFHHRKFHKTQIIKEIIYFGMRVDRW